ncbi:MAG: hypothetical protein ACYTG7_12960 [Planctomycetota bacterium]|jgi:hypothetical protein
MRYFRWIVPSLLLGLAIYLFTLTLNSPGVEQLDDSIPLIQAYPEEAAQKKVHLPGYKKIDKNAEPLREKVESNAFRFSGRLIDAVSKEPVSKYLLRLYVLDLKIQSDPVVVFEGSIEDEAGRFETSIENFGYYRIEASAEGYATK